MREVKFRAWHTSGGMLDWDVVRSHSMDYVFGYGTLTLMQYTGLHDKNGKEVYEGDIVRENKSVGVIIYNEDGFEIDWKLDRDFWSAWVKRHAEHMEVIGNVYESPELLGEAVQA